MQHTQPQPKSDRDERNSPGTLLVLIDADCVLCTTSARWMLRRDAQHRLRIAPLQGTTAANLGLTPTGPAAGWTILARTDDGRILDRSNAILAIGRTLHQPWRALAAIASIVPRPIRDAAYRLVAASRRMLPGKARCPLPSEDDRRRILP
jgi:predicted DCC family thiol-disulfide oxidoreductase YuxK